MSTTVPLCYAQLLAACEAGGATALSLVTELAPAGGPHAAVAPAHHPTDRNASAFGYETRFIDDQAAATVLLDQKQSQLNRIEAAILQGIRDDHPVLRRVPRVQVCCDSGDGDGDGDGPTVAEVVTDLELPQRVFDRRILAGTVDGTPVTAHPSYQAARDSSPANARALLELSPGSLVFGASDSTRKGSLCHYRSALVGEIIGVLAGQDGPATMPRKTGAVACRRIIRTQVLSFAALRQLRFDAGPAGDAACRALLAAYALAGVARSNAELVVRANCDLVEAGPTVVTLDARNGDFVELAAPSIAEADAVLEHALQDAKLEADINWHGQIFEVVGTPTGQAAAGAEEPAGRAAVENATRPSWRSHFIQGSGFGIRR